MVGKILLIVFGSILLALLLIILIALLLPGFIRVKYEDGVTLVTVRYAFWKLEECSLDEFLAGRGKKRVRVYLEQKREEFKRLNWTQRLYSFQTVPRMIVDILARVLKKVRITPLKVHVLVATGDPADTALLYGNIHAALGAVLPGLHRVLHIDNQDIQLFPDYNAESMDYIVDVGLGMRILDLIVIVFAIAAYEAEWQRGCNQRASKTFSEQTNASNTTASADHAV